MPNLKLGGITALSESGGVVTLPAEVIGGTGLTTTSVNAANITAGVLPADVTGGSGLTAVNAANIAPGILPIGVTGGSGLDAVPPIAGQVLQVQHAASSTRVSTTNTGWNEPSTSYRVSITPQYSNSMIVLNYHIVFNQSSAANILTGLRAFRIISGGSKSYALTSRGNSNGIRHPIAGGYIRPGNGYDSNDMNIEPLTCVDHPATTGVCVYGFESYPEGSNTTYWGYSGHNNGTWGWDADIVITATEVKV